MNDLDARLKDVNEAGSYRLNCPLGKLLEAVTRTEFMLLEADLATVHNKENFLQTVAQAVHAPIGFGDNWDALADVLGDLSWHPASGYVLLLRNGGENFGLHASDLAIASEVLADTVNFWRSQGKPYWVFRC